MSNELREQSIEKIRQELGDIEMGIMTEGLTLSQLMREGSKVTTQAYDWGNGEQACALHAAELALRARGL